MLGAIIGDIVGSRWEFNPTNEYNFKLFSDKNSYTDDTICTIAVADAILHGSDDYGEYIHKWCRKYPHPMGGYGGRFAKWVNSDNPKQYGSFGNGAAMRVSPIGWACRSREEVLEAAKATAECTHNHPEGIKGAQTAALAIYVANIGRRYYKQPSDTVKDVITECVAFSGYNIDLRKEDVENRFDETCIGTVPVALWVINQSSSFEDAIRRAVSLGADADTLGAIVGSIAEAIWGIPEEMKIAALSYLDDGMKNVLREWRRSKRVKAIDIKTFTKKYIDYFLTKFDTESPSYYDLFDSPFFPDECWKLGFDMDCGHSFTSLYGGEAWRSVEGLSAVIDNINDIKVVGSALFSQWRYFNHWSYSGATDNDKEWFLMLLNRLDYLTKNQNSKL